MNPLAPEEVRSILKLCLLAAFADGDKSEAERERFRSISCTFESAEVDVPALYQEVLLSPPDVAALAGALSSTGSKRLAYEMAVCMCEADNVLQEGEKAFLQNLRAALELSATESAEVISTAATVAIAPAPAATPKSDQETEAMVLRYAVAAGALELLPQTMATLAIVPLQTKMVYRIGTKHGVELDRKSVGEFMAAIGIGLASQVFEGFARRLAKSIAGSVAGKAGGKLGDAAAGVAMSFATTYALGNLAVSYYGGGRALDLTTLKKRFGELVERGKTLASENQAQIAEQFEKLRGANLASVMSSVG